MPTDVVLLSVTALLAVLALAAAVVAVRAARRSTESGRADVTAPPPAVAPERLPAATMVVPLDDDSAWRKPLHVNGRVVVRPTSQQVVGAALSRPQVRLAILLHGLSHALRAESRDRITALMRREYRRRRSERLAAGRRAIRANPPGPADAWMSEPWIGELPAQPRSKTSVES